MKNALRTFAKLAKLASDENVPCVHLPKSTNPELNTAHSGPTQQCLMMKLNVYHISQDEDQHISYIKYHTMKINV